MIGLSQKAPWPRLLPDPPRFRRLLGLQGTQLWRGGWPGPEDSIYRVSFWNQAQLGILQYNSAPDVMDVTIHSAVGSAGATSEGLGWSNLERGAQPVYKPRAGPSIHKPTEQALAMAHQAVHRATSCGQAHVSGCPGSLSPVVRASPKRAGHVGQQSLRHCNKRTEHRLQSTAVTLPEPSTSQVRSPASSALQCLETSRPNPEQRYLLQEPLAFEVDPRGVERIAFQPKGWRSWTWRGSRVNYLAAGAGPAGFLMITLLVLLRRPASHPCVNKHHVACAPISGSQLMQAITAPPLFWCTASVHRFTTGGTTFQRLPRHTESSPWICLALVGRKSLFLSTVGVSSGHSRSQISSSR